MSGSVTPQAVPVWGSAPAGTYLTTGAGKATNVREDLSDIITRTSPEECPVWTAIGTGKATAVTHEWLTDKLDAAGDNKQKEGGEFASTTVTPPVRLNNVCQIMSRTVIVSETLRAVDTVGGDEYDRQMVMRGLELKRDVEWRITRPLPKVATDPREMAGIPSYFTLGSAGAGVGTMPVGDGTGTRTPGTARALSLNLIADAKQQCFEQGGMPDMGVLSPGLKRVFSTLSSTGGTTNPVAMDNVLQATAPKPTTYVGAVDIYLTDFGPVEMVPDVFAPSGQLLLLDPDYIDKAPLPGRSFVTDDLAKTGDNQKGAVVFEGTVEVRGPYTGATIYDLTQTLPALFDTQGQAIAAPPSRIEGGVDLRAQLEERQRRDDEYAEEQRRLGDEAKRREAERDAHMNARGSQEIEDERPLRAAPEPTSQTPAQQRRDGDKLPGGDDHKPGDKHRDDDKPNHNKKG
jgi:hypothetical protein